MLYNRIDEIFGLYGIYKATIDPASLIDAAGATTNVTAAGVKLGKDAVLAVIPPYSLQGITHSAYVSADDQVQLRLQNESGGTVDLASGEWTFVVARCNRI